MDTVPSIDPKVAQAVVCEEIKDFYTSPALEIIGRACAPFLNSARLTPIELVHSIRHLDVFADSGTALTQAVQKTASAQVRGSAVPVSQRIRRLFDLVDLGRADLRKRLETSPPTKVTRETVPDVFAHLPDETEDARTFRLLASLALTLDGIRGWGEKFDAVHDLCHDMTSLETFQPFDTLVADLVRYPAALQEIIGPARTSGEDIDRLMSLHDRTASLDDAPQDPERARRFYTLVINGPMPATREVLHRHALSVLQSPGRLTNGAAPAEVDYLIKLTKRLEEKGILSQDDAIAASVRDRFGRLLSDETIDLILVQTETMAARLIKAVQLHRQVYGEKAKEYLYRYVLTLATGEMTQKGLVPKDRPPMETLANLVLLHRSVRASTFPDRPKERVTTEVARLHATCFNQVDPINRVSRAAKNSAEKVTKMLDLVSRKVILEASQMKAVQATIRQSMQDPEFVDHYLGAEQDPAARAERLRSLERRLKEAGMDCSRPINLSAVASAC